MPPTSPDIRPKTGCERRCRWQYHYTPTLASLAAGWFSVRSGVCPTQRKRRGSGFNKPPSGPVLRTLCRDCSPVVPLIFVTRKPIQIQGKPSQGRRGSLEPLGLARTGWKTQPCQQLSVTKPSRLAATKQLKKGLGPILQADKSVQRHFPHALFDVVHRLNWQIVLVICCCSHSCTGGCVREARHFALRPVQPYLTQNHKRPPRLPEETVTSDTRGLWVTNHLVTLRLDLDHCWFCLHFWTRIWVLRSNPELNGRQSITIDLARAPPLFSDPRL